MLLLTVYGVVLRLRDTCTFVLIWTVHSVVSGPRIVSTFMLLLTVHGVVSGLRDVCYHATLDCAWRCLITS